MRTVIQTIIDGRSGAGRNVFAETIIQTIIDGNWQMRVLFILDMRTEGGTLDGRSGNDVASWDLVAVSWTLSEYCFFYE